jgi:hypothetical protein
MYRSASMRYHSLTIEKLGKSRIAGVGRRKEQMRGLQIERTYS